METEQLDLFGDNIPSLKRLSREVLEGVIDQALRDISLDGLVHLITNEVQAAIEYLRLCNGENACKFTTLLFNAHRLDTSGRCGKVMSVYQALKNDRVRKGIARAIAFNFNNGEKSNYLYRAFEIGINGISLANDFPPAIARDLYMKYRVTSNSRILDPCAGWGGRMIGASAVCDSYECFEPSTRTFAGLNKLFCWIKSMRADFDAKIHCIPFEDAILENDTYDFALTSPPYYDTEDYCDEETNSKNRYDTFDKWCDGFYLPMIQKTMDALKHGSFFVLNIGSRIYPLNDVLISNFRTKYQVTKIGNFLSGSVGLGKNGREGETFYSLRKQ